MKFIVVQRIVVGSVLTGMVTQLLWACRPTDSNASGEPSPEAIALMLENCKKTVANQIKQIQLDNVFTEEAPQDDSGHILVNWRVTTASVSGMCRFDATGKLLEFIRQ
jgi:hypothetical protein